MEPQDWQALLLLIFVLFNMVVVQGNEEKSSNATGDMEENVEERYQLPAKDIVIKVGLKTGSKVFSEMSAIGTSKIRLEICGDRECCKTDWFPRVCCGAVAILKWFDEDSLGECVGVETGQNPVVSVIHKGMDGWLGEYVFLTTRTCGGYRCNTGNGRDFEVDGDESVKLQCKKGREPGCDILNADEEEDEKSQSQKEN